MGNYEQLKQAVSNVIKTNGKQEITGALLQQTLISIISNIGKNYTFAGVAKKGTAPGTPDENVFYIASEPGVYPNFGGANVKKLSVFVNVGSQWVMKDCGVDFISIKEKSFINANSLNFWATYETFADGLQKIFDEGKATEFATVSMKYKNDEGTTATELFLYQSANNTNISVWKNPANWVRIADVKDLKKLSDKLTKEIEERGVFNANTYTGRADVQTAEKARNFIPKEKRRGLAIVIWRGTNNTGGITQFLSVDPANWEDATAWTEIYDKKRLSLKNIGYSNFFKDSIKSDSEAVAAIPLEYRCGLMLLIYRDNTEKMHVLLYKGLQVQNDGWNNILNWQSLPMRYEFEQLARDVETIKNTLPTYQLALPVAEIFAPYKCANNFNGVDSVISFPLIKLENEGDYMEIEATHDKSISFSSGYSMAQGKGNSKIFIGLAQDKIFVRTVLNNGSEEWLLNNYKYTPQGTAKIKIEYVGGNVDIYVNGVLAKRRAGYVPIYLSGFGKNLYWDYWKGDIGKVKVHTQTVDIDTYPKYIFGANYTNTPLTRKNGFLTDEQAEKLLGVQNVIECSDNKVGVYFNIGGGYYGYLFIYHEIDHGNEVFRDEWRISAEGNLYKLVAGNFVYQGKQLLIGAENEFTMAFTGMGDFTGGYHGDERIDTDPKCYVTFIADGKEYTFDELRAKGTFSCNSFGYRQKSALYTSYEYKKPHIKIAYHVKNTYFENGGYRTKNYIETDLAELAEPSLNAITVFTGVICVHKDCALNVVGNDGTVYTAVHPTQTVELVRSINKADRTVFMTNNGFSAYMDSKLVGTNIEQYKNPPISVQIMDRKDDCKYYSYLPANVSFVTGSFFETECWIKWEYGNGTND